MAAQNPTAPSTSKMIASDRAADMSDADPNRPILGVFTPKVAAGFVKITIYYGLLALSLYLLKFLFADLFAMLPIGGVDTMSDSLDTIPKDVQGSLREIVETTVNGDRLREARDLFFALLGAGAYMVPIAWVYEATRKRCEQDRALLETILLMPIIVAGIVLIVQHSLALAFSLAGIVAGVQFRRALQVTSDSLYIFIAIAVGLAAGVKALEVAGVISILFNYAALITCQAGYSHCPIDDPVPPQPTAGEAKPKKKKKKKKKQPAIISPSEAVTQPHAPIEAAGETRSTASRRPVEPTAVPATFDDQRPPVRQNPAKPEGEIS
ncbi:MAG: hypothetical protein AAGF15_01490 [Pseudomonadota bacterium]